MGRPEVELVKLGKAALPVLLLAYATVLAGCSAPSMFRAESTGAKDIRTLTFIIFAILSGVLLAVWVWLALAIIRYRRNPESRAKQTHGNLRVEIIWTIIPAIIVAVLFYLTVHTTGKLTTNLPGSTALDMKVTSHQWWWGIDYSDAKFATANEIHVPVDRNVSAVLVSADVIHSFWVPQMGGKLDMIPGHVNRIQFLPTAVGSYIGECSEYCGHQHGRMRFLLVVEPVEAFDAWFANQRTPARAPVGATAVAGAKVIGQQPCVGCHTIRGNKPMRGILGPDLTHVGSRQTLAALTVKNTLPNLRAWLKDPQAVKPGNLMPTVPLTAQQLDQISAYLEGLK